MTGEHIRGIPRTYEKEITLADTPYTLSLGYNCVKVDTTGGNVRVNLPNVNYPIDVIKTSSDSYIVTVWVGGVQKATVSGELSKVTIENAEVTKDEPWYPYDAIVGIAGVSGDGGEVLAKDRFGRVIAGGRGVAGTDDATVINTAIASLSSGRLKVEKVLLHGDFSTSAPLLMYDYTELELIGRVKLAANANCDIIENADQITNGNAACFIKGGLLDGNSSNQSGAGPYKGIHWKNPGTPLPKVGKEACPWNSGRCLYIKGMEIQYIKGTGIYIDGTGGVANCSIDRTNVRYGSYDIGHDGDAIVLNIVSDSVIHGPSVLVGRYSAIYSAYGTANHFSHLYLAGTGLSDGMYLNSVSRCIFDDIRVDNVAKNGIVLGGCYGCNDNMFSGIQITNPGGGLLLADNTYHAISIGNDCCDGEVGHNNIFNGVSVIDWAGATKHFAYGINEILGKTDYNVYNGIICRDAIQGAINLTGPHSIVNADLNRVASGSSTGTGSEQTIAHGLASIPVGCKAWITYLVGTRYVTEMIPFDATNVYPTVDNGVAYAWRIE